MGESKRRREKMGDFAYYKGLGVTYYPKLENKYDSSTHQYVYSIGTPENGIHCVLSRNEIQKDKILSFMAESDRRANKDITGLSDVFDSIFKPGIRFSEKSINGIFQVLNKWAYLNNISEKDIEEYSYLLCGTPPRPLGVIPQLIQNRVYNLKIDEKHYFINTLLWKLGFHLDFKNFCYRVK
jgi:hypothetical protein